MVTCREHRVLIELERALRSVGEHKLDPARELAIRGVSERRGAEILWESV